ncbi:MAG: hypothetical protein JF589_17975 [Gemmatimonadetes bacterium]|nr:hypothetical protein [Gemmatimonadota bacterium]
MVSPRIPALMLLRQPSLLFRSLLSMLVLAPLLAVGLARGLELPRAVKIAAVMLAVSPVPPFLPKKAIRAGGSQSYIISLLAISAVVSIVTAPLTIGLLDDLFGICARVAPKFSASWARIVAGAGSILLAAVVLPQLVTLAPAFRELVGNGTLLAITAFSLCTLYIGHLLGGPVEENRSVLALCTATRHPFIAIALVQANFPSERLAVPAVFMALIVTTIASVPYVRMRQARQARAVPQAAPLPQPQSPRST